MAIKHRIPRAHRLRGRKSRTFVIRRRKYAAPRPLSTEQYRRLAQSYLEKRDWQKALGIYRGLCSQGLANKQDYAQMGRAYFEAGALVDARMSLRKALSLDPGDSALIAELAIVNRALENIQHRSNPDGSITSNSIGWQQDVREITHRFERQEMGQSRLQGTLNGRGGTESPVLPPQPLSRYTIYGYFDGRFPGTNRGPSSTIYGQHEERVTGCETCKKPYCIRCHPVGCPWCQAKQEPIM